MAAGMANGHGIHEGEPHREHKFRRETSDGQFVNFQVVDLGRQLYVWVSTDNEMSNLTVAFPATTSHQSPATILMPGAAPDHAEAAAKRLVQYLKRPVALSWNVNGDDLLHLWTERELKAKLQELSFVPPA